MSLTGGVDEQGKEKTPFSQMLSGVVVTSRVTSAAICRAGVISRGAIVWWTPSPFRDRIIASVYPSCQWAGKYTVRFNFGASGYPQQHARG
jgi:hypothetical protein